MNETLTAYERIALMGTRFKTYRRALGISQKRLHEITGVAMSTISLFENGKGQGMSISHFLLILDALDLEFDYESMIPEVRRKDLAKLWKEQNR